MQSLDPRVNRLPSVVDISSPQDPIGEFISFEVFVQARPNGPFQHEGSVRAPDLELAFVLAKEAYTRRFTCESLCVTPTGGVLVSATTDDGQNIYDQIAEPASSQDSKISYEIYHAPKRGKQHVHVGTVTAASPEEALFIASRKLGGTQKAVNAWVIRTADFRFTRPDEIDFWATLPEKDFRGPLAYKGGEKLKQLRERGNTQ